MNLPEAIGLVKSSHEIPNQFCVWLTENFPLWEMFERMALEIARSGRTHYSAYTLREVIRHHTALQEKDSVFKISNNITPYLARLFALAHPQYAYLFTIKALKGAA